MRELLPKSEKVLISIRKGGHPRFSEEGKGWGERSRGSFYRGGKAGKKDVKKPSVPGGSIETGGRKELPLRRDAF